MRAIALALCIILSSCTLFKKESNELEDMSDEVLKRGQGVEIDVKPIPKDKK